MLSITERARARYPDTPKFKVTELLIAEIATQLVAPRANPVRIATKLGVPASLVRFIYNEIPQPGSAFTTHSNDGWGRPELRDFVVCRKLAGTDWTTEDQALMAPLRDQYDDGLIELAQGRDGDFIIQYAFRRSKPVKRENKWFQLEIEG